METRVTTPVFEGPLDLLLQLVNSHEVDLYAVPLAQVVDDFVTAVLTGEGVDLGAVSEFIVVASVLVELKSRRLLPGPDDVEPDEEMIGWEERDLLLARLLECRAYSAAADVFAACMERAALSVARSAGPDDSVPIRAPDLLAGVTPGDLRDAFHRATAARPTPVVDLAHVTVDAVSVAEAVAELVEQLPRHGWTTFRELTGHLVTRMDVIVRFLAVLELCKQGRVTLDQGQTFGELEVAWVAMAEVSTVALTSDEYEG